MPKKDDTKYDPSMVGKVEKVFNEWEPYYEVPVEKQDKNGDVTTRMDRVSNPPPTDGQIAKVLGVNRTTIWRWKEKYPDLCNTIKRGLVNCFEEGFWSNGLTGDYNAAAALFGAKNKLGMADKQEIDQTVRMPDEIKITYTKPSITYTLTDES